MSCCSSRIKSLENISRWKYQGNDYIMYGPYDSLLMLKWISQGYFDDSTLVQNVKFATKMMLKMAVINLKEDAIKYAQSILSCPHHSTQIYDINEISYPMHATGINDKPNLPSTCNYPANSGYSMETVPIVHRNVKCVDDIKPKIQKINENEIHQNDKLDNKIYYCDTHLGQFVESRNDEEQLRNSTFLKPNDTIAELSPKLLDKSISTFKPAANKSTGVETIFGLNEAEEHLKRIEKHKISSYLEKIMCMGSDIQIVGHLTDK